MAAFGIHGAVEQYDLLPDPAKLDLNTVFLVRSDDGAPEGNGLYWVTKSGGVRVWEHLDGLSFQTASEVPVDGAAAGLSATDVQAALLELASVGGSGGGFAPPVGQREEVWGAEIPATSQDAIVRLAALLATHLNTTIPTL